MHSGDTYTPPMMRHKLFNGAERTLPLLFEPGLLRALITWPIFSITSFVMASRLAQWGLRPRTVIDVGANIGQFAVSMAKCFPDATIESYEPVPGCHARLSKAVSKLSNVRCHALALGEANGELQFTVNSHTHSSSAMALSEAHKAAFPDAVEEGTIVVRVATLDHEYRQKELMTPVLLKLDVQGYEVNVLRGAKELLGRVDYILIEMSFEPLYVGEYKFRDMLELLNELGFDFRQPVGFLKDPGSGKYLQMDALFSRRGSSAALAV